MHSLLVLLLRKSNYTLTVAATPTFSITAKAILITPDAGQTKVFGQADPTPFTYTICTCIEGTDAITGLMGQSSRRRCKYLCIYTWFSYCRKQTIHYHSSNTDLQHHGESNPYHSGCRSDQGLWPG